MNYYIDRYEHVISRCNNQNDYKAAYLRISSAIASIIIGRGFNQDIVEYLEQNPTKKEFINWWHTVMNDLHIKAFNKPFIKPAN